MNEDILSYLPFCYFPGIGSYKFSLLISRFGSPNNLLKANFSELVPILGLETARKFTRFLENFNAKKVFEDLKGKGISILVKEDRRFPLAISQIPDPPIGLFIKGEIGRYDFNNDIFISVVGTRRPTSYGDTVTKMIVSDLSQAGCVIVSGMALGIDSQAHWSALAEKGNTIAVLGGAVDVPYPYTNSRLYKEILAKGGLIISEHPPGYPVYKAQFATRNRLISGISRGVVVIEGASHSGTLITARFAAEQGREVFAVPGPITSYNSYAPNNLIKQGARLTVCAADICDELGLAVKIGQNNSKGSDNKELPILEYLEKQTGNIDDIVKSTGITINEVSQRLSLLELKGIVEKSTDGVFYLIR